MSTPRRRRGRPGRRPGRGAGDACGGPPPRAASSPEGSNSDHGPAMSANDVATSAAVVRHAPLVDDVTMLAPNVISVRHWDRLLGGLLYATSPRVDWATLLRRRFSAEG